MVSIEPITEEEATRIADSVQDPHKDMLERAYGTIRTAAKGKKYECYVWYDECIETVRCMARKLVKFETYVYMDQSDMSQVRLTIKWGRNTGD